MYSTHNEGKSVITERFIRILKNKIPKYLTPVSKNAYIDQFTYQSTIEMKPVDVNIYIYIYIYIYILTLVRKLMIKILMLKLGLFLEYQNIKIF